MKAIIPNFDYESSEPLYIQLYRHIRDLITEKEIVPSEKLPSLRNLSASLEVSLTTVQLAYDQLSLEGYIYSRPHSGYYVSNMFYPENGDSDDSLPEEGEPEDEAAGPALYCDTDAFDFNKWKKCMNRVYNENRDELMFESDPQGERALLNEISKYVYSARGVKCRPGQIVIAAGTQQITAHIARILHSLDIAQVAVEDPGYKPVINIFRDRGFAITPVRVQEDGIEIEKLPVNVKSAVYVNPSNQFPTGSVMPAGRRYKLIDWAENNDSYIIEDDYDSELRYFGRPVPALQGIDRKGRVIYLGSFSSTLMKSIKISYMVLPEQMKKKYDEFKMNYDQTCSKAEQLALAYFMADNYYTSGIKKLRKLYSRKLKVALDAFSGFGENRIRARNTESGLNMILEVHTRKKEETLIEEAREQGCTVAAAGKDPDRPDWRTVIFYYSLIPLEDIETAIINMVGSWL